MIIHIQTTAQLIFGNVDDEGNVTKTQPFTIELPTKLTEEVFHEFVGKIEEVKNQLRTQLDTQPSGGK